MANRTAKEAHTIRGTNPQYLIEKIIRTRIYDSRYWKEFCFALTAELIIDRAVELRYIGGIYAGNVKPTPFLCLMLKLLQLQPDKEIVMEFLKQPDYKYLRALAAMYIRLTFSSVEVHRCLEPLYADYRKLRYMNRMGQFELLYMDEFIDNLLREDSYCDIQLPRLQKRKALEDTDQLDLYESELNVDLENLSSESEPEEEVKEKPRLVSKRRSRSNSRERDRERRRERSRSRDRDSRRDRERSDRDKDRSDRDRGRDRDEPSSSSRRDRSDRDKDRKKTSKEDKEVEIAEANELRKKLGLAPLER
ncbi:Pre-mRNA-splicing factor 38 [Aphelenchoides bicaudatus]|nr:Pre-mRNA-splicing factor 38 [Aphelenchoides bicaudatus]